MQGTEQRRVTVHDVAKLAGVSAMTVSRVLSGKQSTSAEAASRVRSAIEATGFRMNKAASNLRQGRILTTIALMVDRLDDPFFSKVMSAAQDVASSRGALLVVTSAPRAGHNQTDTVTSLLARSADGLLLYPSPEEHNLVVDGQPVVLIARTAGIAGTDAVLVDNAHGARLGVSHLLEFGHRRIGLLDFGDSPLPTFPERFVDTRADRLRGFRMAHDEAGIVVDESLIRYAGPTVEGARQATLSLLDHDNPPTAFFGLNGRMTTGVLHALGSGLAGHGLAGIDDIELADVFDPPITVVAQDPQLMGRRGAEMLLDRLENPALPLQRLELKMRLIVRGSGKPA